MSVIDMPDRGVQIVEILTNSPYVQKIEKIQRYEAN